MARKPHVAYFAGMTQVAFPLTTTFTQLVEAARRTGADYVFFSPIEERLRTQYAVLSDSAVRLPGLEQFLYGALDSTRYYAVYRVTDEPVSEAGMSEAVLLAVRRYTELRPGQAWPHTYLAAQLIAMGRPREALAPLTEAERLDPKDLMVTRWQAIAHVELGELDEAALACERAWKLDPSPLWEPATLGRVRLLQRRYAEAIELLRKAVDVDPANAQYVQSLGLAYYYDGQALAAARELEKVLLTAPQDAMTRLLAARAWRQGGDPRRASELIAAAPAPTPLLRALADSLRAESR